MSKTALPWFSIYKCIYFPMLSISPGHIINSFGVKPKVRENNISNQEKDDIMEEQTHIITDLRTLRLKQLNAAMEAYVANNGDLCLRHLDTIMYMVREGNEVRQKLETGLKEANERQAKSHNESKGLSLPGMFDSRIAARVFLDKTLDILLEYHLVRE